MFSSLNKSRPRIFQVLVVLAYCTALSFIGMQYYVSNSKQVRQTIDKLETYEGELPRMARKNIRSFLNIEYADDEAPIQLVQQKRDVYSLDRINKKIFIEKKRPGSPVLQIKFDEPYNSFDFRRSRNKLANYNLKNMSIVFSSQIMQDKLLMHLLNTTVLNSRNASTNGLFVEAGAYDGETWSNTLYLERFRNWTGLLIEPSAENYHKLRGKNRNAYSINSCVSPGESSIKSSYIEAGPFGVITNQSSPVLVTCHPFGKILNQLFENYFSEKRSLISNQKVKGQKYVIDYMSLDIEGGEKATLKAFPWHRFKINLLNVEYNQNKQVYAWLKEFLKQLGYRETLIDDVWYQDLYMAHETVVDKLNLNVTRISQLIKSNLINI